MRYARFFNNPFVRNWSTQIGEERQHIKILGIPYVTDDFTNISPKILTYVGRNLHNRKYNPLCLTKEKMIHHFYTNFKNARGNPLFSVYDDLHPVVKVEENFDSLLIPKDHVSRNRSECYYINRHQLLRAHTTAHQSNLIKMGLDNFIIFGDVYRRDEVDSTHFPVFHQSDAVKLFSKNQLELLVGSKVEIFESKPVEDSPEKQAYHTLDATKVVGEELKATLVNLIKALYGDNITCRWIDVYFPFTHPSWELEINSGGKWIEVLGCGIIRHEILQKAGAVERIGWAFGIGLERIAMHLYSIPDIRLFWSNDTGFLSQFQNKSPEDKVIYQPISIYPQCTNDISFWLPDNRSFEAKYFFDLVRDVGGEIIEQINLIDEFTHPKTKKRSLCYRIVYRHLERTLTQTEVNEIHKTIEEKATKSFGITVR